MVFNAILEGAIAMASLVIALFFLRFWKSTGDCFFLYFSLSFLLQSVNWIFLGILATQSEDAPFFYLIRLAAYALILVAIFVKNRHRLVTQDKKKDGA